jgi:hypothetical protein
MFNKNSSLPSNLTNFVMKNPKLALNVASTGLGAASAVNRMAGNKTQANGLELLQKSINKAQPLLNMAQKYGKQMKEQAPGLFNQIKDSKSYQEFTSTFKSPQDRAISEIQDGYDRFNQRNNEIDIIRQNFIKQINCTTTTRLNPMKKICNCPEQVLYVLTLLNDYTKSVEQIKLELKSKYDDTKTSINLLNPTDKENILIKKTEFLNKIEYYQRLIQEKWDTITEEKNNAIQCNSNGSQVTSSIIQGQLPNTGGTRKKRKSIKRNHLQKRKSRRRSRSLLYKKNKN